MTALLMNEPPLQVLPTLAIKIGLNEAIVLQQLHYWLSDKFRTPDKVMDGKNWVYNTYAQWVEQFPFWGEKTIRRVMGNLEDLGVVISFVKAGFHKVKYYTINYERLASIEAQDDQKYIKNNILTSSGQVDQIDLPKRAVALEKTGEKTRTLHPSSEEIDSSEMALDKDSDEEKDPDTHVIDEDTHDMGATFVNKKSSLSDSNDIHNQADENKSENKNNIISPNGQSDRTREPFSNETSTQMMQVFSSIVLDGRKLSLFTRRAHDLLEVFDRYMGSDMDVWRTVCLNVTRSKFLMGESTHSSFKASLDWVLSGENALKILEGSSYGIGDREGYKEPTPCQKSETDRINKESLKILLKKFETQIEDIQWRQVCTHFATHSGVRAYEENLRDVLIATDAQGYFYIISPNEASCKELACYKHEIKQAFWSSDPHFNPYKIKYVIKEDLEGGLYDYIGLGHSPLRESEGVHPSNLSDKKSSDDKAFVTKEGPSHVA